ncbi:MAG: hypothetical protein O2967_20685 [Proteobacteria bacterium]|nr:hypothetical protein [Pseudomonadota bacterium]
MSQEASEIGGSGTMLPQTAQHAGLFDLRLLFRELWRWKWAVVLVALIGAAKGINDARHFSPIYEAQMTMAPSGDTEFAPPASGGGGLFGAARSFGLISGGGATATSLDYFKQIIGSHSLADVLQEKHGLLQKVFKGSWDAAGGKWIEPQIDESSIRQRLRRYFHFNPPRVPDRRSLANFVGSAVRVEAINGSPFYKISVRHSDPKFALYLLETVYREADELLAANDQRKQTHQREYIRTQLERARLKEVRDALLGVLMQLEQKAMLANAERPYSIKLLEAPWVTPQPKEPNLTRTIGVPTAVAVILILAALVLFISFRFE